MKAWMLFCYGLFASWVPRAVGGRHIRYLFARGILARCGRCVVVEKHARLHPRLEVGDRVQIGAGCQFMIGGQVVLGDDVLLGPEVAFVDTNHRWNRLDVPIKEQGFAAPRPIFVGKGAWIGLRATILPGVHIGEGAIVGAGAVVMRNVAAYAIVIGNPAHVVQHRVTSEDEDAPEGKAMEP